MAKKIRPNATWFQEQLASIELSQRRLAKLLNIEPSAVTLVFQGNRKLSIEEAVKLAHVLGVPLTDVLTNLGVMTAGRTKLSPGDLALRITGIIDGDGRVMGVSGKGDTVDVPPGLLGSGGGSKGSGGSKGEFVAYRFQTIDAFDGSIACFKRIKAGRGYVGGSLGRLSVVRLIGPGGGVEERVGVLRRGYAAGTWNLWRLGSGGPESGGTRGAGSTGGGGGLLVESAQVEGATVVEWLKM